MWRLKQLIPKEQAGLEGKTVDVGSLRLQIRSVIAQGGFSSVYLGRDAQSGKLFALKHIVCNDTESLDLVKKEVSALKVMRGHPNVVMLHAQSVYDMGRTKECFIVTEYCEKMMVDVLESRGAAYFEEKQLLIMFRDICNAVYAMHCESPPIAHRDLKAENVLLGSDGQWKLCDFGSISTNHKRFEKAAEMGVEEDIIRKHTTPAYRAPEMWDLYRRELINEKVDIWALGCLLYRMAYFKLAFDGDSKLQILNGNYRIPDSPKFSTNVTGLIKDMLNSNPEARPTAMQVWQRVNGSLPADCQKASPDKAPSTLASQDNAVQGRPPSLVPTRAPPAPPQRTSEQGTPPSMQKERERRSPPLASKEADQGHTSNAVKGGGVGSFWSTQYAQEAHHDDTKNLPSQSNSVAIGSQQGSITPSPPRVSQGAKGSITPSPPRVTEGAKGSITPSPPRATQGGKGSITPSPPHVTQGANSSVNEPRSMRSNFPKNRGAGTRQYTRPGEDAARLDVENGDERNAHGKQGSAVGVSQIATGMENVNQTSDQAFSEFVADFQKASIYSAENVGVVREGWQVELENLRNELKQAEREKSEIASKYDKLTAICRSQRQEIQDLKAALATTNAKSASLQAQEPLSQRQPLSSLSSPKPELQAGTIWDLQQGLNFPGNFSESQGWKAFSDGPSKQVPSARKDNIQEFGRVSDTFGSARFDISRAEGSKTGASSVENIQNWKGTRAAGGDAWGLHDSFASLGGGFTANKGSGQGSEGDGLMGSASAYNGNSSKGATRPATHNQPSGWSNF